LAGAQTNASNALRKLVATGRRNPVAIEKTGTHASPRLLPTLQAASAIS
jgi:hypothetical protein